MAATLNAATACLYEKLQKLSKHTHQNGGCDLYQNKISNILTVWKSGIIVINNCFKMDIEKKKIMILKIIGFLPLKPVLF